MEGIISTYFSNLEKEVNTIDNKEVVLRTEKTFESGTRPLYTVLFQYDEVYTILIGQFTFSLDSSPTCMARLYTPIKEYSYSQQKIIELDFDLAIGESVLGSYKMIKDILTNAFIAKEIPEEISESL